MTPKIFAKQPPTCGQMTTELLYTPRDAFRNSARVGVS